MNSIEAIDAEKNELLVKRGQIEGRLAALAQARQLLATGEESMKEKRVGRGGWYPRINQVQKDSVKVALSNGLTVNDAAKIAKISSASVYRVARMAGVIESKASDPRKGRLKAGSLRSQLMAAIHKIDGDFTIDQAKEALGHGTHAQVMWGLNNLFRQGHLGRVKIGTYRIRNGK